MQALFHVGELVQGSVQQLQQDGFDHQTDHQQQQGKEDSLQGTLPAAAEEIAHPFLDTVLQGLRINGFCTHRDLLSQGQKKQKGKAAALPF